MKMKYFITLIFALIFSFNATAQDQIIGTWWTPAKDGKIEMYKSGNKYYGKILSGKSNRKDVNNPNPALRNRDLAGLVILYEFEYDADDQEWVNGKIYDPNSGKTYSCKIWLIENGQFMKVKGFIGFSMLGRSETFERVR
ncbi:MAG: hypothetical protein RLY16_1549 [Bacteroidota bacterium]|jgi:uncharacterized protein (DUF2147 family)